MVGVDHRSVTSLNGDWHYLVDQPPARYLYNPNGTVKDNGYALEHPPQHLHRPAQRRIRLLDRIQPSKSPATGTLKTPPSSASKVLSGTSATLTSQPKPGTRTFLHIGAANYRSYVWVNQKRICDHEGGFTPFDCEVTAALHPGSNFVVIAVDSTRLVDGIPSVGIDWFNYGGLTRDVSLVTVPTAFIDDYDVHLKHESTFSPANATTLAGYVHVEGAPAGTPVTLRIPEAGINTTIRTEANGRAPFEVKASKLSLWSPATPKLYKVELASGQDSLTDDIGFRDIRVDGTRILLNGQAVFLEGVNAHAEAPYRTGRVDNQKDVDNIFGFLKDLHANFVRLPHYPHDERMERTADRDGIMVWSEIPLWQRISFDKPEVYAKATFMLNEMIRRDRNKASVILWSVSNETPNNPTRTEFLTNLANEARKLDPTRPITSALIGPKPNGDQMVQNDPLMKALDVVGQNEYIGWYEGAPELAGAIHWTLPQKPFIMSEFGSEAKAGNHGGKNDRWTEEQQLNVYEHQFTMIARIPQIRGVTPWVLMDFRSPTRNIPKLQDGFNRKGLISRRWQEEARLLLRSEGLRAAHRGESPIAGN